MKSLSSMIEFAGPRRRRGGATVLTITAVLAFGTLFAGSAQANESGSGLVTPAGETVVGEILTGDVGTNWDSGTDFTYQWSHVEGTELVNIAGATAKTLILTDADHGFPISFSVSGTVNAVKQTKVSPSTQAITYPPLEVGTAAIEGAATVGNTLTGTTTGWPKGTALSFTWGYSSGQSGGEILDAAGNEFTERTYTVTDDLVGSTIVFVVHGSLKGYEPTFTNAFTELVIAPKTVVTTVAAAAAAPVADSADLAAYLADKNVTVATAASIGLPATSLDQTKAYTARVDGFTNDSFVDAYLYSTPLLVGSFPVVNGIADINLTASQLAQIGSGAHTLVVTGQSSGAVQATAFSVGTATTAPTLAETGVAAAAPLGTAALLLLLGATVLLARRRHATA